jgi:DNA gyrase/topoisomerase IV subunit B
MATKPQKYDESHIKAYTGLEGIRQKSSMYIGELRKVHLCSSRWQKDSYS